LKEKKLFFFKKKLLSNKQNHSFLCKKKGKKSMNNNELEIVDEMDVVSVPKSSPDLKKIIEDNKGTVSMKFKASTNPYEKVSRDRLKQVAEMEKKATTVWDSTKRRRVPFDLMNQEHQKAMIKAQKSNIFLKSDAEEWKSGKLKKGQLKDRMVKLTWQRAKELYGIDIGIMADISIMTVSEMYGKRDDYFKWAAMAALYSIPIYTPNLYLLIMGTEQPIVRSSTQILSEYRSFLKLLYNSNDWINGSCSIAIAWFKTFIKRIFLEKIPKEFWMPSLLNWFKSIEFMREMSLFSSIEEENKRKKIKFDSENLVFENLKKLEHVEQLMQQCINENQFLEQFEIYFNMDRIYPYIVNVVVNDFCKQPGQWKNLNGKEIQIKETVIANMLALQKKALEKYSKDTETLFTDKMPMEQWTPERQNMFCRLMSEYTFNMLHIYEIAIITLLSKDLLTTTNLNGIPLEIGSSLMTKIDIPATFASRSKEEKNSISPQISEPVYFSILEHRKQMQYIRNGIMNYHDYDDPKYNQDESLITIATQTYCLYRFLVYKQPLSNDENVMKEQLSQTIDSIDKFTHQMNILMIEQIKEDNNDSKKRREPSQISDSFLLPQNFNGDESQSIKKAKSNDKK